MNTQSSSNTIINLAFLLAGTASIGGIGITRVSPLPATTHVIENYSSPLSYNTLYNNVMSLSSFDESDTVIPMEMIKKIRIKVAKSEKLEILPY
jgi:hypothetical protein